MRISVRLCAMLSALLPGAAAHAAGQQGTVNPMSAACGPDRANFTVTKDAVQPGPARVPKDKAMVYVIEAMPKVPIVTTKVNIGLDGRWIGATQAEGFLNVVLDPGVHHMCAVYQGHAEGMDEEGRTLLLHLNVEAGKTYYLRYHALFLKDDPGIAFFEPVDADEGQFLLQRSQRVTSVEKK